MNDRRASLKVAFLVAPLFALIFTLHARGDALAEGLGRAVGAWQYPVRPHPPFLIRVPRRSPDVDEFAALYLKDFVDKAVKSHGATLGIQAPAVPVQVVLLDMDAEPGRYGWTLAENLGANEGIFDPAHRMIFVRMERRLPRDPVTAALRQTAARLLLHDLGSSRWSPWLTEGLAGRLEGINETDAGNWSELPSVREILSARAADFRSPAYARGARLLLKYLMERMPPDRFAYYYKAERAFGQEGSLDAFSDQFNAPVHVDSGWRAWLQSPK